MILKQNLMHRRVFGRLVLAGTVRNLTLSLTGMIDCAVTGRYLGEAGLSALKLAAPLFDSLSIFSVVTAGGLSIVLARELAQGHQEKAQRLFRMSFTMLALLALLFTLTGIFCPGLITPLLAGKAEPAVRNMTTEYIRFVLAAAFPIMMYDLFGSAALLEGENRRLVLASAVIFAAMNQAVCACLQGIGKKKTAAALQVVWGLAMPVFCTFLLGQRYGDTGVYLSYSVWQIVSFLLILGWYVIRVRMHKPLLPGTAVLAEFRSTVASLSESAAVSEEIHEFCRMNSVPERMAVYAALCAQELADNSLTHGFNDTRRHHLEVRVILRETDLILRVRDDCRPFDLTERYRLIHPADPADNIGLRMIYAAADDVSYSSALRLNNVCIRVQLPPAENASIENCGHD